MKRKLSGKEIRLCQHSISRMKERIEYLQYLEEYTKLMLMKGLKHQERNKLKELDVQMEASGEKKEIIERRRKIHALTFEILRIQMENDMANVDSEITGICKDIGLLQDQVTNGVEMKEKPEEKIPSGVG